MRKTSKTLMSASKKLRRMRRWWMKRARTTRRLKRGRALRPRRMTRKKKVPRLRALAETLTNVNSPLMNRRRATALAIKEGSKLLVWRWISRTRKLRW